MEVRSLFVPAVCSFGQLQVVATMIFIASDCWAIDFRSLGHPSTTWGSVRRRSHLLGFGVDPVDSMGLDLLTSHLCSLCEKMPCESGQESGQRSSDDGVSRSMVIVLI